MFVKNIQDWYEMLLSVFFVRKCACCGQIAEIGLLCVECRVAVIDPLWLKDGEALDGAAMLFRYAGPLKKTLRQIKFESKKDLLPLLAVELEQAIKFLPADMCYLLTERELLVVPIPTARERQLERGFDIPQVLFEAFAGKTVSRKILERTRQTIPQYGLNPEERRFNLEGCFDVTEDVTGRTILVVDDIFTTGATMEEAARTLKENGARSVYGLALCGSIENYSENK